MSGHNLLGRKVKKIRLEKGLTLEEFGKVFGTNKAGVHNWESGRNLPNKKRLKKIAEIEGVTVGELLNGKEKEHIELDAYKAFATDLQRVSDEYDLRRLNANGVARDLKDLLNSLRETLEETEREEAK